MTKQIRDRRAVDEIHALLEAADPLRHEPELSASDVQHVRHAMLNATPGTPPRFMWWPRALAAAAVVVLMVIAGVVSNRNNARSADPLEATKVAAPGEPSERRQLQFETPGGTRIIWTLDPAFKLEGVAP